MSNLTRPVDPVDILVGYTCVLFLTPCPVLLTISSLHLSPINGVGRFEIILTVPAEPEFNGAFKYNLLLEVST